VETYHIRAGQTDVCIDVFIGDTRLQDGSGLTGLVYDTSGLACYYHKPGGSATVISLVTTSLGSHTEGGFIVIDGTNIPGLYELQIPDACIASGFKRCYVSLRGAANMAETTIVLVEASVNAAEMIDGLITAAKIASDTITEDKIATGAISTSKLAANTLASGKIADGAITSAKIASNAIASDQLAASAVAEIQVGLATAAALAIVDTIVDAIKAKTDGLNFTSTEVDANVKAVTGTAVADVTDFHGSVVSYVQTSGAATTVYIARSHLEAIFGVDNIAEWANLENADPAVEGDDRIASAILWAEAWFTGRMRDGPYKLPISTTSTEDNEIIIHIIATFAGCWLYSNRGLEADEATDRIEKLTKAADDRIDRLLNGEIKLMATQTASSVHPGAPLCVGV